ncbi:MAG: OmpA family protein [Akkermansiaceae bacterium]
MNHNDSENHSHDDHDDHSHDHHVEEVVVRTGMQPLTVALIVIIMVLLCVMLMFSMNGKLFTKSKKAPSDYAAAEAQNAQLRADLNAQRKAQGLPPLPENASTAQSTADRIQRDASSLASLASQWQNLLTEKDQRVRDLEQQLIAQERLTSSSIQRNSELQAQLDRAGNAETLLAGLRSDLARAKQQLASYQDQVAALQNRPSNEAMTLLRKQLNDAIAASGKLQTELDQLKVQMQNTVPRSRYDELAAELAKLRPENNKLRYLVQKLRAELDRTRLFIKAKDLPAEAARLFARLKTLEDATPQELQAAYQNIGETLGAKIIHRQSFATGSSQINFDRESLIKDLVSKSKDENAFFLVVGYASKSGGEVSNQELSSKRATTTASVVNLLKGANQDVKAVYLGETKRFSPTKQLENQICEIWEIKR